MIMIKPQSPTGCLQAISLLSSISLSKVSISTDSAQKENWESWIPWNKELHCLFIPRYLILAIWIAISSSSYNVAWWKDPGRPRSGSGLSLITSMTLSKLFHLFEFQSSHLENCDDFTHLSGLTCEDCINPRSQYVAFIPQVNDSFCYYWLRHRKF